MAIQTASSPTGTCRASAEQERPIRDEQRHVAAVSEPLEVLLHREHGNPEPRERQRPDLFRAGVDREADETDEDARIASIWGAWPR